MAIVHVYLTDSSGDYIYNQDDERIILGSIDTEAISFEALLLELDSDKVLSGMRLAKTICGNLETFNIVGHEGNYVLYVNQQEFIGQFDSMDVAVGCIGGIYHRRGGWILSGILERPGFPDIAGIQMIPQGLQELWNEAGLFFSSGTVGTTEDNESEYTWTVSGDIGNVTSDLVSHGQDYLLTWNNVPSNGPEQVVVSITANNAQLSTTVSKDSDNVTLNHSVDPLSTFYYLPQSINTAYRATPSEGLIQSSMPNLLTMVERVDLRNTGGIIRLQFPSASTAQAAMNSGDSWKMILGNYAYTFSANEAVYKEHSSGTKFFLNFTPATEGPMWRMSEDIFGASTKFQIVSAT